MLSGDSARFRGAGYSGVSAQVDQLPRALQIFGRDENLARPATSGCFPRGYTRVGLAVVAGDSLCPQEATDRLRRHSVSDDGEPNSEHHGLGHGLYGGLPHRIVVMVGPIRQM